MSLQENAGLNLLLTGSIVEIDLSRVSSFFYMLRWFSEAISREYCRRLDKYTRLLKFLYVKGHVDALCCYSTWNMHQSGVCNRLYRLVLVLFLSISSKCCKPS
jgi:hypothetical protein